MGIWGFPPLVLPICLFNVLMFQSCTGSIQSVGKIDPGFQGSQMSFIDNNGFFLLSNSSIFAFGFMTTEDPTLFLLVVYHMGSSTPVWSANRASPVRNSDKFVFDQTGNAALYSDSEVVWSTDTAQKGASSMELQESGNLLLLGDDGSIMWQSFSHPTDTLLSNQDFVKGMKLVSNPSRSNVSYVIEIKSGDMILSAGYRTPQPYWSMAKDNKKTINKAGGEVTTATLSANSWRFYDSSKVLLWQFIFSSNSDPNATWIAVLGTDGFITFYTLQTGGSPVPSQTVIPADSCSRPESCDPYYVCNGGNTCQCPSALSSRPSCKTGISSPCDGSKKEPMNLINAGNQLSYFALGLVPPSAKTDLNVCKASCLGNCSCLVAFFQNSTGNCFMFDRVGSFKNADEDTGFVSYIKVPVNGETGASSGGDGSNRKHMTVVVVIVIFTLLVIFGLLYAGYRYVKRKRHLPESPQETSEEDNFLESISGMPIRFSYKELQAATSNFSVKLGQGGFGSVYQGKLPNGTPLAVKKLEGLGQGRKEFRSEVSIIGSIHHLHLVRLKGFCAEGTHRLLAYEYMANGSLDRWIFKENKNFLLNWETRYNIAVGTAKGLAYLHEDCDVKIIHCDIKPENVLLDDHHNAKVSDFGLAKLMTREQSHVFTTLRGTRGYLAPEWITNYAISEKSDVYSYGMVLLEIIGGRKNYDPEENSEKSHFPSFAFKMMEEGKLTDILDSALKYDEKDERVGIAIKIALWCIQEDMHLRPSMAKVVQMLEGLCTVPPPPTASQTGSRIYSSLVKAMSSDGTSLGPSDCNSDANLSAVRLSGPR